MNKVGRIRVGRKVGSTIAQFKDYTNIAFIDKIDEYYELSPYRLKDENGCLIHNVWVFSKIYRKINHIIQYENIKGSRIVWEWPAEVHLDDENNIMPEYWKWRSAGMSCEDVVKYSNSFTERNFNEFYVIGNQDNYELISRSQARVKILMKIYSDALKSSQLFLDLQSRIINGENITIQDYEGPQKALTQYYKGKFQIPAGWIQFGSVELNQFTLNVMISDTGHTMGYGYVLASSLLGLREG